MTAPIRVTVWNEFVHEQTKEDVRAIYPHGIHPVIADALTGRLGDRVAVRTATLDEPEHGLTETVLRETDVLTWWGHAAHDQVDDKIVEQVCQRVLEGMGLLVLHSAHASKVFREKGQVPKVLSTRRAISAFVPDRCSRATPTSSFDKALAVSALT